MKALVGAKFIDSVLLILAIYMVWMRVLGASRYRHSDEIVYNILSVPASGRNMTLPALVTRALGILMQYIWRQHFRTCMIQI